MGHLLMFFVIFLYLHKGLTKEEICGDTRLVSGEVGGDGTLPVQQTEDIRDITWMYRDKNMFAVTAPGKPVTIRSPIYNGRLKATANGSLIITKLTTDDQGVYKGSVLRQTSGQCIQYYNLILNDLTTEEICGETRYVSSKVGGEVLFPVQQTEVHDITWMSYRDENIFAVTEPGEPVTIRSPIYNERLNVTANGSLIITKITREDQGVYKGSVLRQTSGQCVQFYNLTVYEEEVSRTSTTTIPNSTGGTITRGSTGAKTNPSRKQVAEWIVIILCVLATVALLLIFIISILVAKLPKGDCHQEDKLLYSNLDTKYLRRGLRERNVEEQTVTYSQVKFALRTKKTTTV